MTEKITVTQWQVEVAQAKVDADLARGRVPDQLVVAIANARSQCSEPARGTA